MKISFSGPQSSGKSTLLKLCKEEYKNYSFVDEVTRVVKEKYGYVINEEGTDATQLHILSEHIHNHYKSGKLIMDRCILDGYVYTKYLQNKGQVSESILNAFINVLPSLYSQLDYVFYTDPADVNLVDDGVRSTNIEFRNEITEIFENVINFDFLKNYRTRIIKLSGTVEERMKTISSFI